MANKKKLHTNIAKARLYRKKVDTKLHKHENRYLNSYAVSRSGGIVKRNLHIDVKPNYKGKKRLYIYRQYDADQHQRSGALNKAAHVYKRISVNGKQLHSYKPKTKIGKTARVALKTPLYAEQAFLGLRKGWRFLNKPYEVHYYNTRIYDAKTGKSRYEHGFKIEERTKKPYIQRGVLHRIDYITKKRIHSDTTIPILAAQTAVRFVQKTPVVKLGKKAAKTAVKTKTVRRLIKVSSNVASITANTRVVRKTVKIGRQVLHSAPVKVTGKIVSKTAVISKKVSHKTVKAACKTAWKTALGAETAAISTAHTMNNQAKYTALAKIRQEAQDDASKGAVKVGGTAAVAVIAIASHFNQKRINKPYLLAEKARRKQENSIKKIRKHTSQSQKKAYKRTHKLDKKYFKKTGRHLKIDENIKPVKKVKRTGLENKTIKYQKKQNKINDKLFKLRNKSLISKAGAASYFKVKTSIRNKAMSDAGNDNDAAKAADKVISIADKAKGNPSRRYSKQLKKYSKREEKLHKKSAKKRFQKQTSKFNKFKKKQRKKIKKKFKDQNKKKAAAALKKYGSKFGLIVLSILLPIIIIPVLFVSCFGVFSNEGTFKFVSAYYNSTDSNLSQAAECYQKLAHDLNSFVLSVPDNWKNNLKRLNIPQNYEDEPVRFIFGNSNRLPSDNEYDYDCHKLYSFLCAYLYVQEDDGSIKKWRFNERAASIVTALFNSEYEFKSYYDNTSHWEYKWQFEDPAGAGSFYAISGSGVISWNNSEGNFDHAYGYIDYVGMTSELQKFADGTRLYYDLSNGEILNFSKDYAATGWYLQNQTYDTIDNSGTVYGGWYYQDYDYYGNLTYYYNDIYGNRCQRNCDEAWGNYVNGKWIENEYVITQLDWANFNNPTGYYYGKLKAGASKESVYAEMEAAGYTNMYVRVLKKYDRINECTLYYSVNRKKTFDDAIKEALLSLSDGEERYAYYQLLSSDESEPKYYGLHQIGVSPVYYGYKHLAEYGYFLHDYSYEMKEWNYMDCQFCNNDLKHSGVDIIQNSGSDVYAMISGTITQIGDCWFKLEGNPENRDGHVTLDVLYCNVDTSSVSVGQEVTMGSIISKTTNARREIAYAQYETSFASVNTLSNDIGYDYLSVTIYEQSLSGLPILVDPKLIINLSDNN